MATRRLSLVAVAALTLLLAPLPWAAGRAAGGPPGGAKGGGGSPDVAVTITDSPDPVLRGGEVTYRMTVTNRGSATATSAYLRSVSSLWELDEAVSVTTTRGTCNASSDGQVYCTLGDLPKGATAEITYVGRLMGEGDVTRDASAWSSGQEPEATWADNRAETTTTVLRNHDLPLLARCSGEVVNGSASCYAQWRLAEAAPVTLQLEPGPTFTGELTACLTMWGERSCGWYHPTVSAKYVAGQLVLGTSRLTVAGHSGGRFLVLAGPYRATLRLGPRCYGGGSLFLGRQVCTPDATLSPSVGNASGRFGGSVSLTPAG